MSNGQSKILSEKLDVLIKLFGYQITQGKSVQTQVKILDSVGLKNKDIASILGKTENNIKQVKHNLQKNTKTKK